MISNQRKTIVQAISEVMRAEDKPMSVSEVYDAIISSKLYSFKADQPVHVVRSQIRRHCLGVDFPSSSKTKYFGVQNGKYYLLEKVTTAKSYSFSKSKNKRGKFSLNDLKMVHNQYLNELKQRILNEIKKLEPSSFEKFCKGLLDAYGFRDVQVTKASKDGGIDGYGKLKVGFSYLNVAFQCKRWKKGTIGRPEINQFRGDIQGQFELGLFFTTANFSSNAESNSSKPGAVPIALFNGNAIVEIMLEKEFGVERKDLPTYSLDLEKVFSENSET
jgi:restriction system protein